jgi:hypothetical protein
VRPCLDKTFPFHSCRGYSWDPRGIHGGGGNGQVSAKWNKQLRRIQGGGRGRNGEAYLASSTDWRRLKSTWEAAARREGRSQAKILAALEQLNGQWGWNSQIFRVLGVLELRGQKLCVRHVWCWVLDNFFGPPLYDIYICTSLFFTANLKLTVIIKAGPFSGICLLLALSFKNKYLCLFVFERRMTLNLLI